MSEEKEILFDHQKEGAYSVKTAQLNKGHGIEYENRNELDSFTYSP